MGQSGVARRNERRRPLQHGRGVLVLPTAQAQSAVLVRPTVAPVELAESYPPRPTGEKTSFVAKLIRETPCTTQAGIGRLRQPIDQSQRLFGEGGDATQAEAPLHLGRQLNFPSERDS